jgi:hypothetical protein
VGSEYFINSQELEDKVRNLLPSQGGAGAGFDLSASTQIIPIIDLTESAEGSNLRQDLQSSFSHKSTTSFNVTNATTTIVTTTGYFRIFGNFTCLATASATQGSISISDGSTSKVVMQYGQNSGYTTNETITEDFDFIVFLSAGDSLIVAVSDAEGRLIGSTRQIANIDGELTNP